MNGDSLQFLAFVLFCARLRAVLRCAFVRVCERLSAFALTRVPYPYISSSDVPLGEFRASRCRFPVMSGLSDYVTSCKVGRRHFCFAMFAQQEGSGQTRRTVVRQFRGARRCCAAKRVYTVVTACPEDLVTPRAESSGCFAYLMSLSFPPRRA